MIKEESSLADRYFISVSVFFGNLIWSVGQKGECFSKLCFIFIRLEEVDWYILLNINPQSVYANILHRGKSICGYQRLTKADRRLHFFCRNFERYIKSIRYHLLLTFNGKCSHCTFPTLQLYTIKYSLRQRSGSGDSKKFFFLSPTQIVSGFKTN